MTRLFRTDVGSILPANLSDVDFVNSRGGPGSPRLRQITTRDDERADDGNVAEALSMANYKFRLGQNNETPLQ